MAFSIQPLPGETQITSFGSKISIVILTDKRIYQEISGGGKKETKIIPIYNIDSYGIVSTQYPLLILIGVLMILLGGLNVLYNWFINNVTVFLFAMGIFSIAAWGFTRKTNGIINSLSGGSKIFMDASGGNSSEVIKFFDKIQAEKEKIKTN